MYLLVALTFARLYASALQATADLGLDFSALAAAWDQHAYVLVGALVTGALVAFGKQAWLSNWLASKLPSRALPFVALVLGVLSTSSAEVIHGAMWRKALFDGLAAAITAVFGHEALIESMRKGRELVPPAPWSTNPPVPTVPPPPQV